MSLFSTDLDEEIIQEALWGRGESAACALSRLHDHYEAGVERSIRTMAVFISIRDLRQEIWLLFLAHDRRILRRYDPTRGKFGRFIRYVARQEAQRIVKKQHLHRMRMNCCATRKFATYQHAEADPAQHLEYRETMDFLVAKVSATCDEVDRIVLQELVLKERAPGQVARELGVSVDVIYARKSRLLRKFTIWLQERSKGGEMGVASVFLAVLILCFLETLGHYGN